MILMVSADTKDVEATGKISYKSETLQEGLCMTAGIRTAEVSGEALTRLQAEQASRAEEEERGRMARQAQEAAAAKERAAAEDSGAAETAEEAAEEAAAETGRIYEVSEEDYDALLRLVEAEASGEDIKGKLLVANVVEKGAKTRKIYLPAGTTWYDMNDNLRAYAGGQIMLLWPEWNWFGLAQAGLFFLTGLWLLLTGLAHLGEELTPPTRSAVLGVGATLGFYLLTVGRFGFAPSSVQRIGPTVEVFSALLALLLSTALVRLLYVGQVRSARWLYFLGFAAFLLCTCLELPQTFLSWRNGADGLADLALSLLLALIGLAGLGAAWAVSGRREEQLTDEDG